MYSPKLLPAIVLFLMFIAGCGGSGGGSDDPVKAAPPEAPVDPATFAFKTIYDAEALFKMLVPDQGLWLTITLDDDPEILANITKYADDQSIEAEILFVKSDGDVKQSDSDLAAAQVISSNAVSFANTSAIEEMLNVTTQENGKTYTSKAMLIRTEINGTGYGIFYVADDDKFDKYLEIARHIASNVKLGHAIFSDFYLTSDMDQPGPSAVASDGDNMLVVTCRPESRQPDYPISIVAKLVSTDRSIGPEVPIYTGEFADSSDDCKSLSAGVAFDGQNYLVTYNARHTATSGIHGTRVSKNGAILDQTPILLAEAYSDALKPKVVYDGSKFLVVWFRYTYGTSPKIEGVAVTNDGTVGANFTVAELSSTSGQQEPFILVSNNAVAVAWTPLPFHASSGYDAAYQDISFQLLNESLVPQLPQPLTITTRSGTSLYSVALASSGSQFLVSWVSVEPGQFTGGLSNPGIYGVRLSNTGQAIDPIDGGKVILAPSANARIDFLSSTYHDSKYFFAWSDTGYSTTAGVYAMSASEDINITSAPVAIPATADETSNDFLPTNRQPTMLPTADHMSFIWPLTGVELWDMDYSELE